MTSFSKRDPLKTGVAGILGIVLAILLALNFEQLPIIRGTTYQAHFSEAAGLRADNEVRIAGVKVGSVTDSRIDPKTFSAELTMRVDRSLRLPTDTSAEITSEGLLGGKYVSLVPGGSERCLADGGMITETQGSVSLESLLGRFIFSVTQMNTSGNQSGSAQGSGAPAPR